MSDSTTRSVASAATAVTLPAEERHAVGVDADIKAANLLRLLRIEGQVRGLHRMVQEDRYCTDIIVQIASVQEALRGVARQLMRNHLKHCAKAAMCHGSDAEATLACDEIIDVIYKHLR